MELAFFFMAVSFIAAVGIACTIFASHRNQHEAGMTN